MLLHLLHRFPRRRHMFDGPHVGGITSLTLIFGCASWLASIPHFTNSNGRKIERLPFWFRPPLCSHRSGGSICRRDFPEQHQPDQNTVKVRGRLLQHSHLKADEQNDGARSQSELESSSAPEIHRKPYLAHRYDVDNGTAHKPDQRTPAACHAAGQSPYVL